ncbi:Cytokine receptor-like factor 3 [Saguinus oedipus]|uniref:Cytokine receptor-like factor 3 n=1 Tax=Saguinus oedipus TaxID=9490 RepID=A0ABQ9U7J0_SAGOE|nr:Cytokine receptor-like factor 3 [Saguinus oedipus]
MELEPELLLQEILENVEVAQSYQWELSHQLEGGTLGKLLDEQLVTLLQLMDTTEWNIKPLDDCQKLIKHGVNTPVDLVREGDIAMLSGVGEENKKLWSFTKKTLHAQLESIPEVPLLVDVPCLSTPLDDSILSIIKDHILKHET